MVVWRNREHSRYVVGLVLRPQFQKKQRDRGTSARVVTFSVHSFDSFSIYWPFMCMRRLYCTCLTRLRYVSSLSNPFFYVFTRIILSSRFLNLQACFQPTPSSQFPDRRFLSTYILKTYQFTLWTFVTFIPFPLFIIVVCCMQTLVAPFCQRVVSRTANGASIDP